MSEKPEKPAPETWQQYCQRQMKIDPHGLSQESKEVDEATRGSWDALWVWSDLSPVAGLFYTNYGAAIKVAKRYNFLLPPQNVANHERLKAATEAEQRAFGHKVSWRFTAPRDTVTDTVIGNKSG